METKTHLRRTERMFGNAYQEVHNWLDKYSKENGKHNINLIKSRFKGEELKAALQHLEDDGIPIYKDYKRLNLGCGFDIRDDYLNVDIFKHNEKVFVWDINKFPYPWKDSSFDEILLFKVLHYAKDYERMIRELKRIIKHRGIMRIVVPHSASFSFTWEFTLRTFRWGSFKPRNSGITHELYKEFNILGRRITFNRKFLVLGYFERLIKRMPSVYENMPIKYILPPALINFTIEVLKNK